jgi:succinyl-diaminopimelate desuccinylase
LPKLDSEKGKIIRAVDQNKNQLSRLCSKLISSGTEDSPSETSNIANFIEEDLRGEGFSVMRFEPVKGFPNLVCSAGNRGGRHLILCGHLDVFPAGIGWKGPPFSGRISDGKIYGRGAVDMKAGIAASIFAFKNLVRDEKKLGGKITLALFSDEENMSFKGVQWIIRNHKQILDADACLIGEPARLDVVTIAEKGVLWLRIRSQGKLAHGAYGRGDNAILKLATFLTFLERFKGLQSRVPTEFASIHDEQRRIFETSREAPDQTLLDHVWVNYGTIKGGEKINLVPQICECEVDVRVPLGMSVKRTILRKIKEHLKNNLQFRGITYEKIFSVEPNMTPPRAEIALSTLKNVKEITGLSPHFFIRLGSTDAKFFRAIRIPTVTYGPDSRTMGEVGEFVRIDELVKTAKVHLGVGFDYLTSNRDRLPRFVKLPLDN